MVKKFDENNFDAEVLQSSIPVFVDFYADWCGPCKMMSPVIDQLAAEYEGKIIVVIFPDTGLRYLSTDLFRE